jgi:hypothetical protein
MQATSTVSCSLFLLQGPGLAGTATVDPPARHPAVLDGPAAPTRKTRGFESTHSLRGCNPLRPIRQTGDFSRRLHSWAV